MHKKIYDSVHRFIHIDPLENELINSRPFQRLHYVHQLGVTYFVYPGATHRRFEHSLGAMELATRVYDEITQKKHLEDLPKAHQRLVRELLPPEGSLKHRYWRRVLRLGALCHDLGHLPFSHTAEHELLGDLGHEIWTGRMIDSKYLEPVWDSLQNEYQKEGIEADVKRDVMKLAIGEEKYLGFYKEGQPFTPWEQIVSEIITGDFFGSDRIDYLLRDSQCTGLAYGLFDYHQLIEMLKIIPHEENSSILALGTEENGIESCEALLLARHYMHKRLYQYSSVKSYTFHMARFMECVFYDLTESLDHYLAATDNEVLAELSRASLDPKHPGHFDAACLCFRKNRFEAISVSNPLSEEELNEMKSRLSIPSGQIAWKLAKQGGSKQGLNFPVLRKDGTIDIGANLSEISVPSERRSWIYVAPGYERAVRKELKQVEVLG